MPDPGTGEPIGDDVAAYSQGVLAASDPRTGLLLSGALAAARAYCGWHVIPELVGEELTLDGPGSSLLVLPTLRLTDITALTENGVAIDVETLEWSIRGLVCKPYRQRWTNEFRGIVATVNHGFTTAPDFNTAVLAAVDRIGTGGREVVGPFQFLESSAPAAGSMFSPAEKALLDLYRLEPAP
jgi:hypothetical protein